MTRTKPTALPAPRFAARDAFRVVGLAARCTPGDTSTIPRLWQAFNVREHEIAPAIGKAAYGVCCAGDATGAFRYLAGIEAAADAAVPPDMDAVAIAAARYAVFNHEGHVAGLPATVDAIWNGALPEAGLTPKKAPDFERYDQRFDPTTGRGLVEIWIPLAQ